MFAAVRFFSGMNQHVALEVDFLCGGEIVLCASKGLLTTVYQHMSFQFAGRVACVVALIATVRLLSILPDPFWDLLQVCHYPCIFFHSGQVVFCKVGG